MSEDSKQPEPLVKVKVLRPISQPYGPCLVYGMSAEFPKSDAERFIASGDVELYSAVDLREAVKAIKEVGGEISCDADNAQLIRALEAVADELGGEVADVLVDGDGDEVAVDEPEKSYDELKAEAKAAGLEFPGNISKAKLVELLANQDAASH